MYLGEDCCRYNPNVPSCGLPALHEEVTRLHRSLRTIYCIETGGTFSSVPSDAGFRPGYHLAQLLHEYLDFDPNSAIRFCFPTPDSPHHFGELLDSTNIKLKDQIRLANMLEEVLQNKNHSGIIITHGTDTMAYTAALLSLLIPNPSCPIVLTGAMAGFTEQESDAKKNFTDAATVASCKDFPPGVYVVFNGRIIPGSWVTKLGLTGFDVFRSIYAEQDIGKVVDGNISILKGIIKGDEPVDRVVLKENKIPLTEVLIDPILVEPGLLPEQLDSFISTSIGHGIIIRGYGSGSIPEDLLPVLQKHAQTRPLLIDTQVPLRGGGGAKYQVEESVVRAGLMTAPGLSQAMALNAFRMVLAEHGYDLDAIKNEWKKVCARWGKGPMGLSAKSDLN